MQISFTNFWGLNLKYWTPQPRVEGQNCLCKFRSIHAQNFFCYVFKQIFKILRRKSVVHLSVVSKEKKSTISGV